MEIILSDSLKTNTLWDSPTIATTSDYLNASPSIVDIVVVEAK
jgi:hypothetical protein